MTTTYNYGALTTTFTPTRADCSQTYVAFNTAGSWLQRGPAEESGQQACLPTGQEFGARVYYSPGICPSGFTSAAGQGTATGHSTATATCCPEGYVVRNVEFATDDPDLCATFVETAWVETISSYSYSGATIAASGTTNWRFVEGTSIAARGVVVQRQESDPTWATAAPSTSSPASSSSSSSFSSNGGVATNSAHTSSVFSGSQESSSSSDQGLSQSGKIGVGVGVSLGVLLILAIIFAAFKVGANRRRQQQKQQDGDQSTLPPPPAFVGGDDNTSSFQTPTNGNPFANSSQLETATAGEWKHAPGTPYTTQTHELYQPPATPGQYTPMHSPPTEWKQVSPPPQPYPHGGYYQPPPPGPYSHQQMMHELDPTTTSRGPIAELPYDEPQRPAELSSEVADSLSPSQNQNHH